MAPSEPYRLNAAILRLRVAFHRQLAQRLGLMVDETRLPELVRTKTDRSLVSELELQARLKTDTVFVQWLRKLLRRNVR